MMFSIGRSVTHPLSSSSSFCLSLPDPSILGRSISLKGAERFVLTSCWVQLPPPAVSCLRRAAVECMRQTFSSLIRLQLHSLITVQACPVLLQTPYEYLLRTSCFFFLISLWYFWLFVIHKFSHNFLPFFFCLKPGNFI